MQAVEVGAAKATLLDLEEAVVLQFLKVRAHAALPCPHVLRQLLLAREAGAVGPGVFQQHRVGQLGTD